MSENAGFFYFIGLLFVSGSLGVMHGTAIGCLIFGSGVMVAALFSGILNYLDKGK